MTRHLICLICGLLTLASFSTQADMLLPAQPISLIPLPAQLQRASGSFLVDANTTIVVGDDNPSTLRTATWLSALLNRTRGLHLALKQGATRDGAIVLRHDPQLKQGGKESYTLDVTPQGIRVSARDDAGLFRGATTLWQLLTPNAKQGAVNVPALHIRDQPRFVWRGLMLDSARHFQSVADVKRLLDQMAQHKLNVLHWHLTDDQGWRIEIKQ
ncbi:MAG: family 20 glycosylhydrolase, partial [Pseudomonadota bacterium]|nr:family 20 glycosylhydrolase [Pseudomonadota bacterium]